jgi:hypothetical protein
VSAKQERSLPGFPEADFSYLDAVASALAEAVPATEPIGPLRLLGAGYDSVAVETAEQWSSASRAQRRSSSGTTNKLRLLPWLGPPCG